MTNFEELTENLKKLGHELLNMDYSQNFNNLMAEIERIDHEIWLNKIKLYRCE